MKATDRPGRAPYSRSQSRALLPLLLGQLGLRSATRTRSASGASNSLLKHATGRRRVLMKTRLCSLALTVAVVLPCAATTNLFLVTNTLPFGLGSLSNALALANGSALTDTNFIQFAIPPFDSNTVQTIILPSSSSFPRPLPQLSRRVFIDGYTQPGASSNTLAIGDNARILIKIDASVYNGVLFGPIVDFESGSDGSTVRGLAIVEGGTTTPMINIFSQSNTISGNFIGVETDGATVNGLGQPIQLSDGMSGNIIGGASPGARNVVASGAGGFSALIYNRGDRTVIQGNYLGVNAAGTAALGTCPSGIHLSAGTGVIIGGTNSGAGNLINAVTVGITISAENASWPNNALVQGNLIGTDATGTVPLRTLTYGIQVQSSVGTLVGGTNAGAANVISSAGDGIFIANTPTGAVIQGNRIGTDITGTIALGNPSCGIELFWQNTSTTGGTIGGTNAGEGNIIAFSGNNGIGMWSPNTGWSILGNSIHDNGLLGISLAGCGGATPTPNDPGDTDTGANNLQNYPVITGVTVGGGNVTLSGTLNSTSNTTYRLEFFSNPSPDPRGFGQGQVLLGFTNVTTDASGNASFIVTLPNVGGFGNFSATATDAGGNTSEFSASASASGPCAIICPTNMVVSTSGSQCGATVFFTVTTSGNCGTVTCTPASGSFFPKGTNTVVCSTGSGTNCSFSIAVLDTVPPTVVCPANIVTNVPFGQTNAVVNYATAFSDNCGLASTNSSPSSGSVFPLGVTTVTCTATDTSGNSNFCTFTVTVANTNMPPVASCQNVTTNANASCQAAVPASAVDNGSTDPDGTIVSRTLSPPGPYPKGTNAVTLTVVDNLGASNSCTALVIVLDTTPPTITCPANIVTNASPGQTSVVVTYPPPAVTDNCGVASTNSSPASGSSFPLGTTTVHCTATDTSGNTNTCSFTVTVNASPDHFWTNALGGNYQNAANWLGHTVPAATDNANFTNNASYTVSWINNAAVANAFFHANNGTVTQAIGAFSWVVTNNCDIGTNNTATNIVVQTSGTLSVTNAEGVGLLTVGKYGNGTYQLQGTNTSAVVDYLLTGGATAQVLVRGGAALRANRQVLLATFTSQTENELLASEPGSSVSTAMLQLSGSSRLVISNGASLSPGLAYIGGGGDAYNSNNLAIVTGAGSLVLAGEVDIGDAFGISPDNALIVSNGASVFAESLTVGARNSRLVVDSGSLYVTNSFPGPVLALLGSGTNQLNHSGLLEADNLLLTNAASLLQFNGGTLLVRAATVANGQAFTVGNGSDPATLTLVRSLFGGSFTFSNGLTLGNLATLMGNGNVGGTLLAQSGSTIAPGASIGKIVLTNSPSLQGTLLMEISKSGATLTNDQLQVLGPLSYGGALTVSNLGPDALALGDRFQLFIATSFAGSFSSLSLPNPGTGLGWTNKLLVDGSLEVVTNTLPVAICQNVTTNAGAGCSADVPAAAVDNGSFSPEGPIVSRTLSPAGPYPKGTNAVTLTVVDNQGGSNFCTASIIVLDATPPTITCPANITTNAPPGQSSVVVTYPAPSVSDNCSGVTSNSVPPSGSAFPLGVTVVTCTATDSSGNTNTCSFTVTVNPTAADRFWVNPLGGSYQTAANWLGSQIPLASDNANFTNNTSYQVLWSSDASAASAFFNANSGSVTQAIDFHSWTLTNSYIVGQNAGATSTVTHTGGTLLVTNSAGTGTMIIGQRGDGTYNLDGGTVVADTLVATNNRFLVLNSTFNFDFGTLTTLHGLVISNQNQPSVGSVPGQTATWNVLGGTNRVVVASAGSLLLGGASGHGALLVSGPATVMTNNLQLVVGEFSGLNTCTISNGARVWNDSLILAGGTNTSANNEVRVTGSNSFLGVGFNFFVGELGTSNRLVVESGGSLSSAGGTIGGSLGGFTGANSNSVIVSGPGSLWTDTGALNIGVGIGNSLIISNGGQLHGVSANLGAGGSSAGSGNNNWALVTGAGSVWSNSAIIVGSNGPTTTLIISNGGLVQAGSVIVGFVSGISDDLLAISGGTLAVTNGSGTGTLDIRHGTNRLNNVALVDTDHLLLTNSQGFLQFNDGTLRTKNTTNSNLHPFTVGDGTNVANLTLVGNGVHSFGSGIALRNNGVLSGNGTVLGVLTVQNGGILSPGLTVSIGKLIFSNAPVLQGITFMDLSKNGSTLTNDQVQVSGVLTYGGSLIADLVVSNFTSTPLSVGDRFPLFSASGFSGSFTSLNLPALDAGLAWTNKLLLDGSIEVIAVPLPRFTTLSVAGSNLLISGSGGTANAAYHVLTATNVALPLTNWIALLTNQFDGNGNFIFTNTISPGVPTRFYRLSVP